MKYKKLNYLLGALLTMLLVASCSESDVISNDSGNEATVSFTLQLPDGGPQTRAIGDGKTVDKLVYAVYDKSGTKLSDLGGENTAGFPQTVTITLAKGKEYQIAFWAQKKDVNYYVTDDLKNVTINYTGNNNDESRDAFFKTVEHTVTGNATLDVVLKRPFAQLNVGVTAADWDAAVAAGFTVTQSSVVIENAAKGINLLNGSITGVAEKVSFNLANIPTEDLTVNINGTPETYKYLSMSYFLVNDDTEGGAAKATVESLEFTITNGEDINLSEGLTNVPVQRNYRTNILGKLLTDDIDFNITIDSEFETPDYGLVENGITSKVVNTAAELIAAGSDPAVSTITLGNNITLGANLVLSDGAKTVDLNGKTLTVTGFAITASANDSKLKNGNIEGAATLSGAGTGFSVEDVVFSSTLTTSNTAALADNISFLRGSVAAAITSTNPAKEFNGTALTAAITPGTGTTFKNLTITGAVTASLAANYDTVIFNGAVTASMVASTFTNCTFNAAVTNLSGNSVYTGSIFNGPVTNTDGNADYTDAVFNGALTISAGVPVFSTASEIVGAVVKPGTVSGSTKITYTPAATNTLKYVKQGEAFEAPLVGTNASTIGEAYTSGADIAEVSASEHIGLYEVTTTNLIVKFVDITLSAGDIAD